MENIITEKRCSKCGEVKAIEEFYPKTNCGFHAECKDCSKERSRKTREKNPEKYKDYCKNWRLINLEEVREKDRIRYKPSSPEKAKERDKRWRQNNPGKIRAKAAKRRAAKLRCNPKLTNSVKIQSFYDEAIRLTKETGIPHEVDHIVPINGINVSGLHVDWNLQILTKSENSRKKNKY